MFCKITAGADHVIFILTFFSEDLSMNLLLPNFAYTVLLSP